MAIRVGVIGAGIMGADHARILQTQVADATVSSLVDVDLERARRVAAALGIPSIGSDAHRLITADNVDAVLIASSDATHADFVHACLEVGKPVLCEKPLAPTAAECLAIVDHELTVVRGGLPLVSVGFMRRFDPGYVELRALIDSGELGTPLLVHSAGRGVGAPAGNDELTITGSAIHDIDIASWLIRSAVVSASWLAPRQSPEVSDRRDPQFLLLRTEHDILVPVDIFLNAKYGYDIRCEVVGSLGSASLTEPHRVVRDSGLAHGRGYAADWRPRFADAYRLQNQAWIDALGTGSISPLATATDGLRAALVADAVIASMHSGGEWVQVGGLRL